MAVTLVVEDGTGLATANSFCSLAQSDAYHETRAFSTWATNPPFTDAVKTARLVESTRWLSRQPQYIGELTHPETPQALAWPRINARTADGILIASNVVPSMVAEATAELAWLLQLTSRLDAASRPALLSDSLGPSSYTFAGSADDLRQSIIPRHVMAMIAELCWYDQQARVLRA